MTRIDEIAALASGLAIVALLNWLAGDRSFLGEDLLLRQTAPWSACRWFGLGLWIASVVATSKDDLRLESAGLVGAIALLIGTARKAQKSETSGSRNQRGRKTNNGEQAAASDRDKPPN